MSSYKVEKQILKDNNGVSGSINHFVHDDSTNLFYVGAVNRLFKLSQSLDVQQQHVTGPEPDNRLCIGYSCDGKTKELTDNYNKILLIETNTNGNDRLVICGSIFQGFCEFRDLTNISKKLSMRMHTKLVTNAENASTVGLIVKQNLNENILFIGASYPISLHCKDEDTKNVFFLRRKDIPALSMRKLTSDESAFSLYKEASFIEQQPPSALKILYDKINKYIIDYVSAFSIQEYTYFLSYQSSDLNPNCETNANPKSIQSRISLTCNRDTHFYSYIDIPLTCGNTSTTNYKIVRAGKTIIPGRNLLNKLRLNSEDIESKEILIALFENRHNGKTDSAVCIFTISKIQRKMKKNLRKCQKGREAIKGSHFDDGATCIKQGIRSGPTLCTTIKSYYGGRKSGVIGAKVKPAIVFQNTALTSVTLTTTSNFTVAFLGTSHGHLKKIVIEGKTRAREYDRDIVIDEGSPINQDTFYDIDHRNLYLTSQRLVAKVPVENCGQYASCPTCLASKDPFCGWCTLENRCTLKSICSMADQSTDRWKILTDCTAIDNISPPMASSTENITLYMSNIDIPRDSNYSCVFDFGNKQQATPVSFWNFGISCKTPQIFSLGVDFGPTGSKNATLSIRSEETKKLFLSRYFTFYNCGSFASCTVCTDNNYACDWCVYENKCTFRTNSCNGQTIFSNNIFEYDPANDTVANHTDQMYGEGKRRGPTFCPKINKYQTGDVYIHNNTSKEVVIIGSYFPGIRNANGYNFNISTYDEFNYKCIIKTGAYSNGNIEAVAIRVSESQIKCQVPLRSYELPESGILEASLRVTWGRGAEIENDGMTVYLYSCYKMAHGDCSLCKNFEQSRVSLNCQWCDNPLQCQYKDHCSAVGAIARCPGPHIDTVTPRVGHVYGGTIVTIQGRNLGAEFVDVKNNVTIAGVACYPNSDMYQPAREIVCILGASDAGVKKGHVVVLNKAFHNIEFQYMNPILQRVTPNKRAVSGGAILTLHGDPIYLGTSLEVTVNDKVCNITSLDTAQIKCRLPPGKLGESKISVKVDGHEIRQDMVGNTSLTYVADPEITKIQPLKSFKSGGRRLTVMGTNINIIDHPKMFIWTNFVKSNLTNCQVKNETFMFCPSPKLLTRVRRLRRSTAMVTAAIGFIMDNAVNVQNLTGINSQLQYYPDPSVYKFGPDKEDNDNVKLFKSEIVIINGKNLMVAAKREDVQVAIGNANCNVTNLSEDQIVCNPPTSQPKPTPGYSRSDIPAVVVQIGNEQYFVGYLEYEKAKQLGIPLDYLIDYLIGGVAGVGLFIVVTIIICSCIYRRQKNKSKREFEKMRYQLDNMESNFIVECIEDMLDLNAEIGDGRKPLYRYDDYTFKILFPQMQDHVVLHPPIPKNGSNERQQDVTICHFSQLLHHKEFLLKFIRTLEKQKSFGDQDKSNVASLLIILYQNNLEYITEIIKSLLKELVEKSAEEAQQKGMLWRTKSVVEKLLDNWLALCMYKNLEESTGTSLYVLYKALKFQVKKGPVDAVTGDAMYSLSEDRLLKTENILEHVTITLNVEYEGKKYKCRCLDCDTITQAIDKMLDVIYRNIPYSTRPSGEDLDLDWVSENKTLQDEDNVKLKENGWKQLNMIKDYKLPNGAEVVLSQYQKCRPVPRSPCGTVHVSECCNPEAVPSTGTDSQINTQYWHLVKQPDESQTKGLSSENYHTRLLATKGTLKQDIDDFIKTVLTASPNMPPVIKYLFDFLDDAAKQHNITDPEVAYTWKCNSLLLRFWVNIIKNPDFVFDIHKTAIVDSCLSVVAQCFIDICSTTDQTSSKDSQSLKSLFAKDIPVFKKSVSTYFEDIQRMPAVSDQDLNVYLAEVSKMSTTNFTKENALVELYSYVQKYSNEINESLEAESLTEAQEFPERQDNVITNTTVPSNV
ncbi:plexin A [Mytilus galloprovincialis]|uniref:Plexin A n=1 Tax=Mytilus galloprovincialis TaxID=29158 RepID=A0A8B6CGV6_MYTGA|nr:plexin A [Mytilus galloprovincialis]